MGKQIHTYSEHVPAALVIRHAKQICLIILPSVAFLAISHYSTSFKKWEDLQKKVTEHKLRLIISTISACNTSHSKKNSAR
jgi:hypothetical protein